MKNIIITVINVLLYISFTIISIFGVIWYGKLPKVSMYHLIKEGYSFKETFNDDLAQSKQNKVIDKAIVLDTLHKVCLNANELSNNIPLRDKNYKVIGSQGLYSYLSDIFKKELEKL